MNLVYGLALLEFSVAQVDRAPARYLGGHRFEFCRGRLRFFSLPHARDPLIISSSHLFHLNPPSFIFSSYSTILTLLILAVCRTRVKYEPSI